MNIKNLFWGVLIGWAQFSFAVEEGQQSIVPTNAVGGRIVATLVSGSTYSLEAQAEEGYTFIRWLDGLTDNPRVETFLEEDARQHDFEFKALFALDRAVKTTQGVVTISTVSAADETFTLTVQPGSCATFKEWSSGEDEESISYAPSDGVVYPIYNEWNLLCENTPATYGYIEVIDDVCGFTLRAIANDGYHFAYWEDDASEGAVRQVDYTNDSEYAGMLLDAAASEALDEGAHDIIFKKGIFEAGEIICSEVSPFCDVNAPRELTFLPTLFMLKELSPFVVFPALYPGESIGIPKETAPSYNSSGLYLGRDDDDFEVYIPLENLSKHAFLSGVPGSGKTNSILHIVTELYNKNIPFLVLEPAKQEYRALVNREDMRGITIFSPSSGTKFLLHINPFEFPLKMSLAEHIRNLINVFDGAFSMDPPMPFLLDQAIEQVYRDKGWLPYMINDGSIPYPMMEELYDTLEKILDKTDYEGEIKGNLKSILQVRIGSLLSREMGDVFNVPFSTITPENWLKRSIIIELESMGSGPANFLTLMLSTLIRESLKVNPMTREEKKKTPARHVIVFEEAHNLIGSRTEKASGENADPKIAATAFIVKMLAEVRALNEVIIIADQLPTAMAPEVIKNTSLKLGHRMTSADDRELLGSTMSADEVQMERMATFSQGKALAIYEGLLKPFEMQIHQWSRIGDIVDDNLYTSPDDDELYSILSYTDSPFLVDMERSFRITQEKFEAQWDRILDKIEIFHENLEDVKNLREEINNATVMLKDKTMDSTLRVKFSKTIREAEERRINTNRELREQYDSLCDQIEEIIFALSSYRKQNIYYSKQIVDLILEKIRQYRDFLIDIKEKFGFERSKEQRQRRDKLLQQLK